MGIAQWQHGMLATALCVFDIFRGRYEGTAAYAEKTIKVLLQLKSDIAR